MVHNNPGHMTCFSPIGLLTLVALLSLLSPLRASDEVRGPEEDRVTFLPGLPADDQPKFHHYSGYLEADSGRQLHYWFVESQGDPASDPVVLWLNGGPGCSSLAGLLEEHGPFLIEGDGVSLRYNKHSWNKIANMLYLESPAGVGYSYSPNTNLSTGDYHSAENNYFALQSFFKKFPYYKDRALYLTGESYAGIYIPLLAFWVVQDSSMNFKGMAIGNGVLDWDLDIDSLVYFLYTHGIISNEFWTLLNVKCCPAMYAYGCAFSMGLQTSPHICKTLLRSILQTTWSSGLNPYNLYQSCAYGVPNTTESGGLQRQAKECTSATQDCHQANTTPMRTRSAVQYHSRLQAIRNIASRSKVDVNKTNKKSQDSASNSQNNSDDNDNDDDNDDDDDDDDDDNDDHDDDEDDDDDDDAGNVPPCLNDTSIQHYMNQAEVRQALHIPDSLAQWNVCSSHLDNQYSMEVGSVAEQFMAVLKKNKRILVYNGDLDMACNFLGDHWFVDALGLKEEAPYKAWLYTDHRGYKQIAGYAHQYTNLDFVTVKGSGHFVPTDKPYVALEMFRRFLYNEKF